jgi:methyltransferase (TIGR00027 family)
LKLLAPEGDWRARSDMDVQGTRIFRASIVARARFIEDLVEAEAARGVDQYVILGAGLDSFAQRRQDIARHLTIFEIDRPGPQAWKRQRLMDLGFGLPQGLRFVPVDFEAGETWRSALAAAGFDESRPAVFAATGLSMYLSKETNAALLCDVAGLAAGSTLAMTFLLPLEMVDPVLRPAMEMAKKGASAGGTPFVSFFTPPEIVALAREAGFREVLHVSAADLTERYFAGRPDGLRPPDHAEELLLARA